MSSGNLLSFFFLRCMGTQWESNSLVQVCLSTLLTFTPPEVPTTWCLMAAFRGLLFYARFCWLYDIPDTHANSRGDTSSLPPMRRTCLPRNLYSTSIRERLPPVYFRKQVYFLFIFCSSAIFFEHATHTIYATCQKGYSSQYPTTFFFFIIITKKCYYYYYYSLRVLHTSISRWLFTGLWVVTSLPKSPGHFSIFWPISTML